MSDLQRKLLGKSVPRGLPPRPGLGARGSSGGGFGGKRSYTGVSWRKYWHRKETVQTKAGKFCVYHGGSESSGVSVCLLHGAGYSGLTWSVMAEHLATLADCRLLALDLRGHGETQARTY